MSSSVIAILIPSLNPGKQLVDLVVSLRRLCGNPVILVNDGSRPEQEHFFEEAAKQPDVILLRHPSNLGKGCALKTGFREFLSRYPDGLGVCTADDDGQHHPEDIFRCCGALRDNPRSMILGIRDFSGPDIPWKSYCGNTVTCRVFCLAGIRISDTQSGLRGIPRELIMKLVECPGERFEFETEMLIRTVREGFTIREEQIKTLYQDHNAGSRFRPIRDTFRIGKVILKDCFRRMF